MATAIFVVACVVGVGFGIFRIWLLTKDDLERWRQAPVTCPQVAQPAMWERARVGRKGHHSVVEPLDLDALRAAYGDDTDEAVALLMTYGEDPADRDVDRVRDAVLRLSAGDLMRLRHNIAAARSDYRDVLFWANNPADASEPKSYEELVERLRLPPDKAAMAKLPDE